MVVGRWVNNRMLRFWQEKDMMDRIRQCCISTTHRRPVLTHFSKQNYMQGAWHYKHEVCTWFVLHSYRTPRKTRCFLYFPCFPGEWWQNMRWCNRSNEINMALHSLISPSNLSVRFNLNLNSCACTAIYSITYPYHWTN